ncbi:MAG: hypothetical protein FOGNACKC_01292 [Anaerolineae bacterium]|nr:hypothetical protein [Anaerolineae bacterium]
MLTTYFMIGLGVGAVVVVITVVLLVMLQQAAQRILNLALQALPLVQQINKNTNPIWNLNSTNQVALNVLRDAESIRDHGTAVAQALHDASAH